LDKPAQLQARVWDAPLIPEEYHVSEKVGICVQQKCKIKMGIDHSHVSF